MRRCWRTNCSDVLLSTSGAQEAAGLHALCTECQCVDSAAPEKPLSVKNVDYECDGEDERWLRNFNEGRGASGALTLATLEELIDRALCCKFSPNSYHASLTFAPAAVQGTRSYMPIQKKAGNNCSLLQTCNRLNALGQHSGLLFRWSQVNFQRRHYRRCTTTGRCGEQTQDRFCVSFANPTTRTTVMQLSAFGLGNLLTEWGVCGSLCELLSTTALEFTNACPMATRIVARHEESESAQPTMPPCSLLADTESQSGDQAS